jgi:pyruvate dehydrogenase E2 component (dihydrolipoamide acetyltransferase)
MTSTISRSALAIVLALGMLAAVSAPSHAALSSADRSAPAATASTETLAVAAAPASTTSDATAPAPVAAAAAPVTAATAPVQPRKVAAAKPQPRVSQASRNAFASGVVPRAGFARRGGYPCH